MSGLRWMALVGASLVASGCAEAVNPQDVCDETSRGVVLEPEQAEAWATMLSEETTVMWSDTTHAALAMDVELIDQTRVALTDDCDGNERITDVDGSAEVVLRSDDGRLDIAVPAVIAMRDQLRLEIGFVPVEEIRGTFELPALATPGRVIGLQIDLVAPQEQGTIAVTVAKDDCTGTCTIREPLGTFDLG